MKQKTIFFAKQNDLESSAHSAGMRTMAPPPFQDMDGKPVVVPENEKDSFLVPILEADEEES